MKVRFWDRLLAALGGLILFLTGLVLFLWAIRSIPAAWVGELVEAPWIGIAAISLSVVMVLLGVHGITLLFRRTDRRGFVVQKTEHGQLSISIHAMENLVKKCVDRHEELTILSNRIQNTRDGVVVELRIGMAGGVSIPLVVSTLQKQIKQYITSCSGIDVREVRVEVETGGGKAETSPFVVPDGLMGAPSKAEPEPAPEKARPAPQPMPQPLPVQTPPPVRAEYPEPDKEELKQPLHQRLFRHKDQPAIVPVPPELGRMGDDAEDQDTAVEEPDPKETRKEVGTDEAR